MPLEFDIDKYTPWEQAQLIAYENIRQIEDAGEIKN